MEKHIFIKNSSLKTFSARARLKSFRLAFEGLVQFFREEHNAIIHLLVTVLVIGAAFIFRISKVEMIAVGLATGFVWTAELINTSIEKLADLVSKDFHLPIKYIKDVSAAAVLVAAVTAVAVGAIVFIPKIFP